MTTIRYAQIDAKHPEWNGPYWDLCERLRLGGSALLKNDRALRECLRPGMNEPEDVWCERSKRPVYPNYPGEICGYLVATVYSDPLTIALDGDGDEPAEPSDEWKAFLEDVSRPSEGNRAKAKRVSFQDHMKTLTDRALTDGVAYTLVDFPKRNGVEVYTKAQEAAAGLSWPYLCEIEPSAVIDWEDDDVGDLSLAVIKGVRSERASIQASRDVVVETFRVLDREKWQVWQFRYRTKPTRNPSEDIPVRPKGPQPEDEVKLIEEGAHTFGCVPLVRHRMPSALWAMDRMFSLACATLQNASGAQWLLAKTNTPTPFLKHQNVKLDTEQPADEVQGARKMPSQTGGIMMLAERDELGWSSPPPEPLKVALEMKAWDRSETYRTMDAMARAIDPSAASNKQSGESKSMDASTTSVISGAIGEDFARAEALTLIRVVEAGRGDEPAEWLVTGCEEVEIESPAAVVDELASLVLADLPAPFMVDEVMRAYRIRHPEASKKRIEEVRKAAEEKYAQDAALKDAEHEAAVVGAERTVDGNDPATGKPYEKVQPAKSKGKPGAKKK